MIIAHVIGILAVTIEVIRRVATNIVSADLQEGNLDLAVRIEITLHVVKIEIAAHTIEIPAVIAIAVRRAVADIMNKGLQNTKNQAILDLAAGVEEALHAVMIEAIHHVMADRAIADIQEEAKDQTMIDITRIGAIETNDAQAVRKENERTDTLETNDAQAIRIKLIILHFLKK